MRIHRLIASFLFLVAIVAAPVPSHAAIDIAVSVNLFTPPPVAIAPPPLPVYVIPGPPLAGYVWLPGYWRWVDGGYFWVPGTWVAPPAIGVLWTPGYWGWGGNAFLWHEGYWGPHVGFYGGVNYGGGYVGHGFVGGAWNNGHYVVERNVINVNNVTNVNVTNLTSFNGGPGGINAAPTAEEHAAMNEKHMQLTGDQMSHIRAASTNPAFAHSANHGKPPIAATPRAGAFSGQGVVAARQAGVRNPEADKHNATMRQNPSMAQGAMPRAMPNAPEARASNTPRPQMQRPAAQEEREEPHPEAVHEGEEIERGAPREEEGRGREGGRE